MHFSSWHDKRFQFYTIHRNQDQRGDYLRQLRSLFRSFVHFGQYHLPLGFVVSPTHWKWNHSIGHSSLSHPIISPNETWLHKQYVGSLGSIGNSGVGESWFLDLPFLLVFAFFLPGLPTSDPPAPLDPPLPSESRSCLSWLRCLRFRFFSGGFVWCSSKITGCASDFNSGGRSSFLHVSRFSTSTSICRVRVSTKSIIFPTSCSFSSPYSWLFTSRLCIWIKHFLRAVGSFSFK